jgi:hypothetical protein
MRTTWPAVTVLAGFIFGACDAALPLESDDADAVDAVAEFSFQGMSVPHFQREEDVPQEFLYPRIVSRDPHVFWMGEEAVASSDMTYFGNRAEQSLELYITGRSANSRSSRSSGGTFWPLTQSHRHPGIRLRGDGSTCGHSATLHSQHVAKVVFFVEIRGLTEISVEEPSGYFAKQPDCTCGGDGGGQGGGGHAQSSPTGTLLSGTVPGGGGCGGEGSGGGGSGVSYCFTQYWDHYWYYPSTGQYRYRYTTSERRCTGNDQ